MTGKQRRLNRILVGPDKRCLLIPMDHAPWLGPVAGIDRPREITQQVIAGGANALLVTPGFLKCVHDVVPSDVAIVLRVSVSAGLSAEALQEVPAVTAITALQHDVDAVAVSVFFGRGGEVSLIRWLGQLMQECAGYGIPVIAEMMPPADAFYDPIKIAHAARIGMELGADIIKTNYSGDIAQFSQVVCSTVVPIIVAGGPSQSQGDDTLEVARDAVAAGAAGVAFGRRVWQAPDPEGAVRGLREVVFATRRVIA